MRGLCEIRRRLDDVSNASLQDTYSIAKHARREAEDRLAEAVAAEQAAWVALMEAKDAA